MIKKRKTTQKQLLQEQLMNRYDHPTALALADELQGQIGTATIYRNLRAMVESNYLTVITTPDNIAHYDINNDNHCHLVCDICYSIYDVDSRVIFKEQLVGDTANFKIDHSGIVLKGTCYKCQKH